MAYTVTVKTQAKVEFLKAECGVRYWEDATVNGVEDEDGALIPLRIKDAWCPIIHLESGRILDWPEGTEASIHYKVCDDGNYHLCDETMVSVVSKDGYVPSIMSPKDSGYGDYVIMDVGKDGVIADWRVDLSEWNNDD